jgi:hypothetical protein
MLLQECILLLSAPAPPDILTGSECFPTAYYEYAVLIEWWPLYWLLQTPHMRFYSLYLLVQLTGRS